jgi:hypothetical protein
MYMMLGDFMQPAITRRELVKTAALLPLAAARGTAANSAVTVGLIGSGGRGTFDAGLLVNIENARLVALCDIYDDRIERIQKAVPLKDPKVYKDYRELLASDVDAVIVATPVFLHPEHFEAGCGGLQARDSGRGIRRSKAEYRLRLPAA